MANFFSIQYCRNTERLEKAFSKIKIPVFIIACGVQAESYDHLDELISRIGDEAKRFIDAIYHTGGEFALRGNFTKEFFDLLGYHSAVVTGCPSLYQMGPDIKILKSTETEIRPLINGRIQNFEEILKEIPGSIFMAQDSFLDCLYDPDYFSSSSLKKDIAFSYYHSVFQADLLGQGRVKLIPDANEWLHFIKDSGCNYSFGTKIHGSIMPILARIPSTVVEIDSRTREMAEFFHIPSVRFQDKKYSKDDVYEAYTEADYSLFNKEFVKKYRVFEGFLKNHGIVKNVNIHNKFFLEKSDEGFESFQPNREKFVDYALKLKKEKALLEIGAKAMSIKNSIYK